MKKVIIIIFCILVLLYFKMNLVNIHNVKKGEAFFNHNHVSTCHVLTDEEVKIFKETFNNKMLYRDNPSCGFTDNISVRFDNTLTFCFACDNCNGIYWKEKDKYFDLSDNEKIRLHNILEKYGFYWPCI